MRPGISDVPALPSQDQERLERAREEFKKLTEYIGREARAEKPPRHLRFQEAEFGSRKFFNLRYFDKDTKAVVSEEIHLDPSLLLEGPPGAFYAVLWHEFGHGEPEYREVELDYETTYADRIQADKASSDWTLNIKLDVMIDADNLHKRPGLAGAYRALYEDFFPENGKEQPSRLRELAEKHGLAASAQALGSRLEGPLRADDLFLISLKHESYWRREHDALGTPEEERAPNPYGRLDPDIAAAHARSRQALALVTDPTADMGRRSQVFDTKILAESDRLKAERRGRLVGRLKDWLGAGETSLDAARGVIEGLVRERHRDDIEYWEATIAAHDAEMAKLEEKAKKTRGRIADVERQLERHRIDLGQAGARAPIGLPQLQSEAVALKDRLDFDEKSLALQVEKFQEAQGRLASLKVPVPKDAEQAVDWLLEELDRHAPVPPLGPPHASEKTKEIDESDAHHPDNPEFGKMFPGAVSSKKGDKKAGKSVLAPGAGKPDAGKSAPSAPAESQARDLEEARRIRNLIDGPSLEKLATGLTLSFIEDREKEILKDLPQGRLPQARKAEAVRRRYSGERDPQVRELQKRSESFMGVDVIVANDHSGSMAGAKEDAAKAANLALADAALRVNTEIASRMRGLGLSDAEIRAVAPVRYLGIVFSDEAKKMNSEGWETPLERKGADPASRQAEREAYGGRLFGKYREVPMGGTRDRLAATLALYEAFASPQPAFRKPEERVKVFIFVTDGAGDTSAMSRLMAFLHGKSEEFPAEILYDLDSIEAGTGEKVLSALRKYRDQVFALGVGIYDGVYEKTTFTHVYNEGREPQADSLRAEEENVLLLPSREVRELPARMLKLVNGKFQSRKFRAVRERFKERGRRARRTKG